jgi:hypothetical protein
MHAGLLMSYVVRADTHPLPPMLTMGIYALAPIVLMFGAATLIDGSRSILGRACVFIACAVLTVFAVVTLSSPFVRDQLSYVIVLLIVAAVSDMAGRKLVRGTTRRLAASY